MTKTDDRKIAYAFTSMLGKATSKEEEKMLITSLVSVLKKKRVQDRAYGIVKEIQNILHEKEGYLQATLTVAHQLSVSDKDSIKEMVKKRYKAKDVLLIEKLDERVIGGIKIQVGDEVFDATIKNKLQELGKKLKVN